MNTFVIRKATQGLAEYICENGPEGMQRGVVIAYDSRWFSQEFAKEAALVLARNGVKAFLFDSLRPTPELSFAVRHLNALAGIVITASHNPKEYNGYKVYWEDGGQIPPQKADAILSRIRARRNWIDIEPLNEMEAINQGLLVSVGADIDKEYLRRVKGLAIDSRLVAEKGSQLKIVYTPLNGAGNILVRRVLSEMGFSSVIVVPEQENPDPEFTTVPFPNPEIPSVFNLARKYGEDEKADILLATDPDADRLGVVIRNYEGSFVQLTGNQVGVLLVYYILSRKRELGILSAKATIVKTIASTDLADDVAAYFGARVENVHTGFKFIGEKVKEMVDEGWGEFLFGFEESYGYLAGDFVRDKDAIIAAALLCEAALYYKTVEGRTLLEVLREINQRFGYYIEEQESLTLKGKLGREQITKIMENLRQSTFAVIGGLPLERVDDYESLQSKHIPSGQISMLNLPQANVLRYNFSGGGFLMARPSGTEPKIKFYFSVRSQDSSNVNVIMNQVKKDFMSLVEEVSLG